MSVKRAEARAELRNYFNLAVDATAQFGSLEEEFNTAYPLLAAVGHHALRADSPVVKDAAAYISFVDARNSI